jgi:hypothetical protein
MCRDYGSVGATDVEHKGLAFGVWVARYDREVAALHNRSPF